MTKDEALKLALEALTHGGCSPDCKDGMTDSGGVHPWEEAALIPCPNCQTITAIKEALAQQELTFGRLTANEFLGQELYEFQEATGCDTAAEFKAQSEQEPAAMRYDFDGYGYKYIDSGSGSDWQTRIENAEPVYATPPKAEQEPVAWTDLLREARDNCKASIVEEGISASRKEYRIDLEARLTAALNTTPPTREWIGLPEEQFLEAARLAEAGNYLVAFQRIQQWLKDTNA